jgi:tetratricopeptide (TPR) repeat protein
LINQGHVGFSREPVAIVRAKVTKILSEALGLFSTFGSAYALRGLASLIYEYNWSAAEVDLREALRLSPDNELAHCFLSHLLVSQRRFDEGLEHARRASELDYGTPMTVATEPWMMLFAGKIGEAVAKGEKVVERFGQSAPAHIILGHAYRASGANAKAAEQYTQALEIEFHAEAHASLGFIHAQTGRREEALASLDAIRWAMNAGTIAYVSSYFDALVYAGLGEYKRSLDALDRAAEEKCDWLIYLAVEPRWRDLRSDPRFASLQVRIGLAGDV